MCGNAQRHGLGAKPSKRLLSRPPHERTCPGAASTGHGPSMRQRTCSSQFFSVTSLFGPDIPPGRVHPVLPEAFVQPEEHEQEASGHDGLVGPIRPDVRPLANMQRRSLRSGSVLGLSAGFTVGDHLGEGAMWLREFGRVAAGRNHALSSTSSLDKCWCILTVLPAVRAPLPSVSGWVRQPEWPYRDR